MNELKNCPFCDAENTDVGFIRHSDDCYLMRKYMNVSTKQQLRDAWNARLREDALASENTELRELLARMDYVAEKIMVEYLFWADLGKCPPEFILYRELLDQLHARVQKILEKK